MKYLCCFNCKNKNKITFSQRNEYFSNSDNSSSINDTLTEALYTENPLIISHEISDVNTDVNTDVTSNSPRSIKVGTESDIDEYVKNRKYTISTDEEGWSEVQSVQTTPDVSEQNDSSLVKAAVDGRHYLYT